MQRLLWVDLEMTGLDVEKERVIELAAMVTDLDFNPEGQFHRVVKQPKSLLEEMDEWNKKTHKESGLLKLIPDGVDETEVDQDFANWIETFFGETPAVLSGNSIHQDRKFLDKYFPKTSAKLHYRMLDVSSFKLIYQNKFNIKVQKGQNHRALDDIEGSINELKQYLSYIQIPNHDS